METKLVEKNKKILILTASPIRDKYVDESLANHLRKLGNEVWVRPCLREGRAAVLELQPDIVVVPPIRNPYSRDFAETMKSWGIGVISRHTEASCDWDDFKKMDNREKQGILGSFPYQVNVEIVWGNDEAEILSRRNAPFKTVAVGSFAIDYYLSGEYKTLQNRELFNTKYKFDVAKKNLLIGSPWGFCDSAPDLNIDETSLIQKDIDGRSKYIEMIKYLKANLKDWNILITIHPGVNAELYKKELPDLQIDSKSSAAELLVNCDMLIHSGSTMAIEAHCLNISAFQYGDVNIKMNNWFIQPNAPLSKVSPYFNEPAKLLDAINAAEIKTNASPEGLKVLENGRYGLMDGKATERAAEIINKVEGKFKLCWPKAHRDYDQLTLFKDAARIISYAHCSICDNDFIMVRQEWLNQLSVQAGTKLPLLPNYGCPHCGTKLVGVYNG